MKRKGKKCHQYHDHFNINKSGRYSRLIFLSSLRYYIVNFLKYAGPAGDILAEESNTLSTYAYTPIRANFHIKMMMTMMIALRSRMQEGDTKGRLDAIEENCLNINEK